MQTSKPGSTCQVIGQRSHKFMHQNGCRPTSLQIPGMDINPAQAESMVRLACTTHTNGGEAICNAIVCPESLTPWSTSSLSLSGRQHGGYQQSS